MGSTCEEEYDILQTPSTSRRKKPKASVMVYGGEDVQPLAMGVFTELPRGAELQLGVPPDTRLTYGNDNGKLLYFHHGYGWLIDDVGCQKDSRGHLFSHSEVQCPSLASNWFMWHGEQETWLPSQITVTRLQYGRQSRQSK